MSGTEHKWTTERKTEAARLWQLGWSARQISDHLGGVSRNGVIGVLHRMGLSGRATPSKPAHQTRPKAALKPRLKVNAGAQVFHEPIARAPLVQIKSAAWDPLPGSTPRPFTERPRGGCRWPIGPEAWSCCEHSETGRYCPPHEALGSTTAAANAWHLKKTLHRVAQ